MHKNLERLLFSLGLGTRLTAIIFLNSELQTKFYAPFLARLELNLDPWAYWISSGGSADSFPYGLTMLLIHAPSLLVARFLELFGFSTLTSYVSGNLILILVADLALSLTIKSYTASWKYLFYWLNPIFIYINYLLGSNDALPGLFIMLSGIYLMKHKSRISGIFFGIALGMKISLLILFPFFLIFFVGNPRYRNLIKRHLNFALLFSTISYIPLLYSQAFRKMIFSNPEISKILSIYLPFGQQELLVFPLIYAGFMYWLWRAGRTSLQTLQIFLGAALISLAFVNPSALGWLMWGIPLLIVATGITTGSQYFLQTLIPILLGAVYLVNENLHLRDVGVDLALLRNLVFTLSLASLAVFLLSTLRHSVEFGDVYKLGRRPIAIAISGDSGTGKSTLSGALSEYFGRDFVVEISGDDYHKFERDSEIWNRTTHLNPDANNVGLWASNLSLARQRKPFKYQPYDHQTGKFANAQDAKIADLIISSGLHAGYEDFHSSVDLKIHLEIEESLRTQFKIFRDTNSRGKSVEEVRNSIESRKPDADKYIISQRDRADVVLYLSKIDASSPHFTVNVSARDFSWIPKLADILDLNKISEYQVNINNNQRQILSINSNSISSEKVRKILEKEMASFEQFFVETPLEIESEALVSVFFVFLMLDWKVLNR